MDREAWHAAIHGNYDKASLKNHHGEIAKDFYGRTVPKPAHGSFSLKKQTSSSGLILDAVLSLFDKIVDKKLLIRRITIDVNHVMAEPNTPELSQMDLFTNYEKENAKLDKEKRVGEAMIDIKRRYGKNAILKGINFEEGATGKERNMQIGGHKG